MESAEYVRSGELMEPEGTVLVLVDVQQKLLPLIAGAATMQWNIRRLLDAAGLFAIPVLKTEQYPQGLGTTIPALASYADTVVEKTSFSCVGASEFQTRLAEHKRSSVLVVGIETHVCIMQTSLDLLAAGYRVFLPVDAVGARNSLDHDVAIRRMETSGATLTTTEATLFEWCRDANATEFKAMRELVVESAPS